jgi:hypothetical protein
LWEDVVLHIARLTDPPESPGSKPNLTLLRLPFLVADPALRQEVQTSVDAAKTAASFAKDWRNRRLAHRDLALALENAAQPLPGISRQNVEVALSAFRVVLNTLHEKYFDSKIAFELFQVHGDAEALVYHLGVAKAADERRFERLRRGNPLPEDCEEPSETQPKAD